MPELKIKRIAVLGPESTGKTYLCKELAEYFKTVWVPEYARTYVEQLGRKYNSDDILKIAQEQFKQEEQLISKAKTFLFTDTEFIISKTWCEDVFKFCHEWILEKIESHQYDLYLLTSPDLQWQTDPVRENKDRRDYFFNLYLKELANRNFDFEIISGTGNDRTASAIAAVKRNFPHLL